MVATARKIQILRRDKAAGPGGRRLEDGGPGLDLRRFKTQALV